ncbi:MAG: 7-cyano-7-deazaguanine synthase QueC [Candidatus Omnitrophota bacterium]|jgi:7-cyano-7-deazaguanine synthase
MKRKIPAQNKAVVLLSGGLDSAVVLYLAKNRGFDCRCLVFDYGQRHSREMKAARDIAGKAACRLQIIKIGFPWKGSALLDKRIYVPEYSQSLRTANTRPRILANTRTREHTNNIPSTYVPGRNIIFLSFALSCAEAIGARSVFIGAHAQDYSGYPDCRPEFYRAFRKAAAAGTKAGVENRAIAIETPLIHKTKAQIINCGRTLGVPFGLTWSCYRGGKKPCGKCDSCCYRAKGFKEAGLIDPASQEGL